MGVAPKITRIVLVFGLSCLLIACAGSPETYRVPVLPQDNVLAQADAALAEAADAGAAALAPVMLREARRRIATARTVLLRAATDGRELTEAERVTVEHLAAEAVLDARLALARTQAAAVVVKIDDLQAQLKVASDGREGAPPAPAAASTAAEPTDEAAPAASELQP